MPLASRALISDAKISLPALQNQLAGASAVKQRLDAQMVAREQEFLFSRPLALVVDCQGEHASQAEQEIVSILFVHAKDNFGVRT